MRKKVLTLSRAAVKPVEKRNIKDQAEKAWEVHEKLYLGLGDWFLLSAEHLSIVMPWGKSLKFSRPLTPHLIIYLE